MVLCIGLVAALGVHFAGRAQAGRLDGAISGVLGVQHGAVDAQAGEIGAERAGAEQRGQAGVRATGEQQGRPYREHQDQQRHEPVPGSHPVRTAAVLLLEHQFLPPRRDPPTRWRRVRLPGHLQPTIGGWGGGRLCRARVQFDVPEDRHLRHLSVRYPHSPCLRQCVGIRVLSTIEPG